MTKETRKLTKEEFKNVDWGKSAFTRAEIREIDRRANNIGKVQSFTSDEILKEFEYEKE